MQINKRSMLNGGQGQFKGGAKSDAKVSNSFFNEGGVAYKDQSRTGKITPQIGVRRNKVESKSSDKDDNAPNNQESTSITYKIYRACSQSHGICGDTPIVGVRAFIGIESKGETNSDGELTLTGESIIGEDVTFKHNDFIMKTVKVKDVDEDSVELTFKKSGLRDKINKELTNYKERSEWSSKTPGAMDEHWCYSIIAIHHAGDGDIDTVEKLEAKHMNSPTVQISSWKLGGGNGWADIGYHYIVDKDGTIYEGCEIGYRGIHVAGNNSFKIGVCLLGDYNSKGFFRGDHDDIPEPQITACTSLINVLKKYFPLTEVGGHSDYAKEKGATCPGDILMPKLDEIRTNTGLQKPSHYNQVHANIDYTKCSLNDGGECEVHNNKDVGVLPNIHLS